MSLHFDAAPDGRVSHLSPIGQAGSDGDRCESQSTTLAIFFASSLNEMKDWHWGEKNFLTVAQKGAITAEDP